MNTVSMQSARGFEYGVRHILSPQSGRLSDILLSTTELSKSQIQFLLDLGSIYVKQKRIHGDIDVEVGDHLRLHTKPRRFLPDDGLWPARVLYCNEDFIIANKISGLPVHASVDNNKEHLLAYLTTALDCDLFVTHRLDVPTRGLIVFAKTASFQSAFNKLLIENKVTKIYRARVQGQSLIPGPLTHYMEPSPRAPKTVSLSSQKGWQECRLQILSVNVCAGETSELRIQLQTGRTHQIRAQLSHEGHPIVGDHSYGAKKISENDSIELEACELQFTHPRTGEELHFRI